MGVINALAPDYIQQLTQLLPQGPAWPREGDSSTARVFAPAGTAMATLHARLNQLIDEEDARTTSELLTDWERVAGLPDPCLDDAKSVAERRARVVQRLTYQGGQSPAFFIGLLASLGYPGSTVTEFRPMKCNSKCNAAINQGGWPYGFRINVPLAVTARPMTVTGRANDPLTIFRDPGLACLIAIHKPAQTVSFVGYGV